MKGDPHEVASGVYIDRFEFACVELRLTLICKVADSELTLSEERANCFVF